jgi:acetolactate synthase small subunit
MTVMLPIAANAYRPDTPPTACFSIHAWAEPGVMPRVLALFAKRGMVPTSWHSRVSAGELTIDVQMRGLDSATAGYIAACLRRIMAVTMVLIYENRPRGVGR